MRISSVPRLPKPTPYGYRVARGFVRTEAGDLTQKFFWLGPDPLIATAKLTQIEQFFGLVKHLANEKPIWREDLLNELEGRLKTMDRPPTRLPTTTPVSVQPLQFPSAVAEQAAIRPATSHGGLSLHHALDQFSDVVQKQHEKSGSTRDRICHHLRSLRFHLPDRPLNTIGFEELQSMRSIITARPPARRQADSKTKRDEQPVGIVTVRNWLAVLGQAFKWFRATGRWRLPPGMEIDDLRQAFSLTKKQQIRLARTRKERERLTSPDPVPSIEELAVYYKLALPTQRLYLLLGVCLGWRQTQIAEFRRDEIRAEGMDCYIDFERTKTGVKGSVWVCPELAELLVKRIQVTPENPENRAFLGHNDLPLLHRSDGGNVSCAITQAWDRLRKVAERNGVTGYPFSALRRFAGQAITNLGDPFLAQVFLAQGVDSVLELHYAARGIGIGMGKTAFERLYDVQREVHRHLKPMFDTVKVPRAQLKERVLRANAARR